MNKWVVMMVGFAFVIAVGVGVVLVSGKTDEEVAADITFLSGVRLTKHGQEVCQKKVEEAIGEKVYSPNTTSGDRISTISLVWEGRNQGFNSIVCVYNLDQGITSLKIDGKTYIPK